MLTAGSNSYTYDANGNMVTGPNRTVTYDGDNHPVNINGVTLAYDADGSRVEQTNNGVTTTYLSDDYEVTSGVATKYFSLGDIVVARRVGTTTYWLCTDSNGSIQAETNSAGAEVQRQKYWAYGAQLQETTALPESRGYTGQRQDSTGLFYLHARYYDPVLGRFISPDPTVPSDAMVGLNHYAYAVNDPINHTDINGMGWFSHLFHEIGQIFKGIVGIVEGALHGNIKDILTIVVMVVSAIVAPELEIAMVNMALPAGASLLAATATASQVIAAAATSLGAACAYVGAAAAVGFASSFTIGEVNGDSFSQALHQGLEGAAMSAGMAAIAVGAKAFSNAEWQFRQDPNHPMQTTNFTGLESAKYTATSDGSAFGENGWLGHSAVGRFLNSIGYSSAHDGLCRFVFDAILGTFKMASGIGYVGASIDFALTVVTNLGPAEFIYGVGMLGSMPYTEFLVTGAQASVSSAQQSSNGTSAMGMAVRPAY